MSTPRTHAGVLARSAGEAALIRQEHGERSMLTVMDSGRQDQLLKSISTSPACITLIQGTFPWKTDASFPYLLKCLKVEWSRVNVFLASFFVLKFSKVTVSSFTLFTFRIGRTLPTSGLVVPLDVAITMNGVTVLLSSHTSKIDVPMETSAPKDENGPNLDNTKHTMKTVVIPLKAFNTPSSVSEVKFDLAVNGTGKATLYLSNVAFWT